MNIEKFLEVCSMDELVALKRNSFSRNLVLQNRDIATDMELFRFINEAPTNQIVGYLFICINLTIHGIDEGSAPVSFGILDDIYKNAIFNFQYLKRKNAFVLTLFRNEQNESNFVKFFNKTYFGGAEAAKSSNPFPFDSFLDFGFIKCAMTLEKTYGIQDLLEVSWRKMESIIESSCEENFSKTICESIPPKVVRFVFSAEHPDLSTITVYADDNLNLFGKTKIVDGKFGNAISKAFPKEFKKCKYA